MANKKEIKSPFVKPKVIIALAVQDTVKTKMCLSLICALREADFDYDIAVSLGCDLIGSRTRLVRQAKELGGTHMLFIDHDMFLNPFQSPITGKAQSPISRLLSLDKDIVGAPYNFRSLPLKSTASPLSELSDKTQPYRCNVVATGFMLIKMSAFDKIPEPWFNFGRDKNGELVWGEDTFFCQQAIKAGLEVWADGALNIQHVGEYNF